MDGRPFTEGVTAVDVQGQRPEREPEDETVRTRHSDTGGSSVYRNRHTRDSDTRDPDRVGIGIGIPDL